MRKKDLPPTKHDIPFKYPLIFLFTAFIFGLILFAVDKYNDTNEVYGFSVKEPTVPAMQEKIAAPPTELVVTEPGAEFSSNEILIKVKENAKSKIKQNNNPLDTGIAALDDLNKKNNVKKFERVAKPGKNSDQENALFRWYKITLDEPQEIIEEKDELKAPKVKSLLYEYKKDPDIEAVEPNYIFHTVLEPNDPYYLSSSIWHSYPDLWGMHKINASVAWDQTTGSSAIVVADIDTGVDRNHPDLAANIWTNPGELPNNGIDDDKNGYIDDYYGWNFVKNTGDPMDDHGHGTHTAGTIAAVGNNAIGVVGVNWQAKIMVLKFLDSGGSGSLDSGIKALQYAADMGARVSSNSWGCECNSVAMDDAVKYEHDKGMVMVAAAGNDNSDAISFSPTSADYAVSVAASDSNDAKASFSNWGERIDVAAPGVYILSTIAANDTLCAPRNATIGTIYCILSGTSMATPHVAGLAALLLSKNPSLNNEEIRQIIRLGADDLGTPGKDSKFGYGRINAAGSMALANTHPLTPIITSPRSRTFLNSTTQIIGSVPGTNFKSYKVEVGIGRQPSAWFAIANSNTQVINGVLATLDPKILPDGLNIIRLTAIDISGKIYQFQVHDIEIDNMDASITSPYSLVASGSTVGIFGNALTKNGLAFTGYKLEWGQGTSPTSWSASGITLINGGTQPVNNGQLGIWDTSSLIANQAYSLRLIVSSALSNETVVITITADSEVASGWPKTIERSPGGEFDEIMPAVADVDGDGNKEVIIASSNKVFVFRKDGSNLPGFPAILGSSAVYSQGTVNVADLDNDGKQEIVVPIRTQTYYDQIAIYRSDGTIMSGWPKDIRVNWEANSPTIADLNGDGTKEIIVKSDWEYNYNGTYHYKIHAYRANGSELPGFPSDFPIALAKSLYDESPPFSISDLDKDGKMEMAFGFINQFYLLDNAGKVLPGWPYTATDQNTTAGPMQKKFRDLASAGDIDGDGQLEIVAFAGAQDYCTNCPTWWYAWKKDGMLLAGFPKTIPNATRYPNWDYIFYLNTPYHQPALVDMNGDGKDEIIGGFLDLFTYTPATDTFAKLNSHTSIGTGASDIDGDGKFEFTTNGHCCPGNTYPRTTIINDDGTAYWKRYNSPQFLHPLLTSDLDNDGRMELIGYRNPLSDRYDDGLLVVWTIPTVGLGPAKYEWPMLGHDPARTGRLIVSVQPPDTQPPTAPTNLVATAFSYHQINLAWTASTDNVGVVGYDIYRNGTLMDTTTSTSYSDAELNPLTTYTYYVKARDAAGLISGASNTASATTPEQPDTTAPSAAITYPSNGAVLAGTVTVTASATDNVGVTNVEFYLDDVLKSTDITAPYSFSWDTKTAYNGNHTLSALAYDVAGNIGISSEVHVVIANSVPDTIAPSVGITYPAQDTVVTGTINVNAIAQDNVGVTKVEFYLDDVLKYSDAVAPYIYPWDTKTSADGNHTLSALAYDAATNVGISSDVNVIVSNGGLPSTPYGNITGTATSSLGGVLSGVTVSTTVSGKRKSTTTDSKGFYRFTNLPPGTYILKLQAKGFLAQSATVSVTAGATTVKNVVMSKR